MSLDIRNCDCMDEGNAWKPVLAKWRQKFQEDDEFTKMLQEVCREYLKEHPEYDIKKRMEEQNKPTL